MRRARNLLNIPARDVHRLLCARVVREIERIGPRCSAVCACGSPQEVHEGLAALSPLLAAPEREAHAATAYTIIHTERVGDGQLVQESHLSQGRLALLLDVNQSRKLFLPSV